MVIIIQPPEAVIERGVHILVVGLGIRRPIRIALGIGR